MVGDQPSGFNEGSTTHPQTGQRPQTSSPRPTGGLRGWAAIALAGIATVVAVAALIVALTGPSSSTPSATSTYTAADIASAQQQLCDTYTAEARTVRADTSGNDEALARVAATNGAVMLYNAAANPALGAKYRDAARALATAYGNVSAMGSKGVASDAEWRAVLDDANAKDAAMKQVCGGG
jgi:negative regulator of sigma E activity